MNNLPPNLDEIEVSLFGPGYGECITIHIGNNEWIIIDSCIEPISKKPASIKYLNDINVNPETSVKAIIATHWHDDHVRGISKTLQECRNAEFVCSGALQCEEFLILTNAYSARSKMNNGLKEFSSILSLLNEWSRPPKFAIADRCLLRLPVSQSRPELEIFSLTPSDESITLSKKEITNLLPKAKEPKKDIIPKNPNHSSVVTLFKIDGVYILLGADLYNVESNYSGWKGVINSTGRPTELASVYKISHHGSNKSDNPIIWSELLTNNPYALLTPFSKGNVKLPTEDDVNRISGYTDNAFITSTAKTVKIKREKVVEKFIKGATRSITPINTSFGQVQIRAKISDPKNWTVKLYGAAISLNDY